MVQAPGLRIAATLALGIAASLTALEAWLPGPLGASLYVPYRSVRNAARDALAASPPSLGSLANRGPNVVLVVLDCFRSDYLDGAAPALHEFASRSWRYDSFHTAAAWTKPSTASLFTGLYVRRHMVGEVETPLPAEAVTLAELLHGEGYATAGFVWHNPHIARRQGFDQGFADYYDDIRPRGSKGLLNRFLAWLDDEQPAKFFAYLHFEGSHDPYVADNDLRTLLTAPGYDGDLDFSDTGYKQQVKDGRVLSPEEAAHLEHLARGKARKVDRQAVATLLERIASSPLAENTLLILTSDHGDAFFEHGTVSHGGRLFGEEIHAPLAIRFPERFARERGFEPQGRDACPASTVDLLPTVLDFAGIAPPRGIDGVSIVPGSPARTRCDRGVVSEAIEDDRILEAALVSGTLKLIVDYRDGKRQLFDLAADPEERRDLAPQRAERTAALAGELGRRLNADGTSLARWRHSATIEVSPEEDERLRALGYVE